MPDRDALIAEVERLLVGVWELPKVSGQINDGAAVWWGTSLGNLVGATQAGADRSAGPCTRPAPTTRPCACGSPAFRLWRRARDE
jgi:predicted RecA/RadA family phage recombinase